MSKEEGHIIYVSKESVPFDESKLHALLNLARTKNHEKDVTGMLLYSEGCFFQVLEGNRDKIHRLFKKISLDDRHEKVVKLIEEPIEERSFGDWSMGYVGVKPDQLKEVDGLKDFFGDGGRLMGLDAGRARTLAKAFTKGKWRVN